MAASDAQCPYPALYLLPLDESFYPPKRIPLPLPPGSANGHGTITAANGQAAAQGRGAVVRVGRQLNQKTAPAAANGVFESRVLSRQHAEVWVEGGRILIRDVKSSNGTFVNGERLSGEGVESDAFELRTDDILEFGIDILGEHGEVVHRKVAARATCAFSPSDAQRAVRAEARAYPPPPPPPQSTSSSNAAEANPYNPNVNGTRHARSDSASSSGMGRGQGQGGLTGMGGMGAERIRPLSMGVDLDGFLARVRDGPRAQSSGMADARGVMDGVVDGRGVGGGAGQMRAGAGNGYAGHASPSPPAPTPPATAVAATEGATAEEDPLVAQLRAQLAGTRAVLDQAMSAASSLALRYTAGSDAEHLSDKDGQKEPEMDTDALVEAGTRGLREELAALRAEVREAEEEDGRRKSRGRAGTIRADGEPRPRHAGRRRGRTGTLLADVEPASPMRARARENADEDDEEEEDGEDTRRGEGGDAGEEDEAEEGWADDLDFRAEVADMKVPLSPASAAARVERLRGVFDEDDDVDVVEGSSEGSFLGGLGESVGAAAAAAGAGEAREDEEGRGQEVEVEVDGVDALRDGDEVIPATSDSGADEAALAARLDILAEQLVTLQSRLAGMQAVSAGDERGEGRVAELDGRVRALEETVDAPSPIPAITLPTLPPPASTPPPAVPADVEELKSSLLSSFASLKTEWATFRTEAEAFSSPAYPYAPRADDSDSDSDSGDAKNTRIGRGPTWREDPDDARVPGRWGLLTPAGSVRALSPHRNGAASALGAGPRWPLGALLGGDGYGTGSAFGEHWNATTPVQALAAANGVAHQEDDEHDGSPKDHMSPPLGDPTRKEGASKTKTRTDPFLIVGALGAGAAIVAAAWWGA